jgi:hypothetical protein
VPEGVRRDELGYDVEFIQVPTPAGTEFPVDEDHASEFIAHALTFDDPGEICALLLDYDGTRQGPEESIDYLGSGMSYARIFVRAKAIFVENNCSAKELLGIYEELARRFPSLLIYDLQSKQLHDSDSYMAWWNGPL